MRADEIWIQLDEKAKETNRVKVELLANKQKGSSVKYHIERGLGEYLQIYVAVAYVTQEGLNLLLPSLRKAINRKGATVRVLIGISRQAFNDPEALKELLYLYEMNQRKFQFGISTLKDKFHQKTYAFDEGPEPFIILGSSNLTKKALVGQGELNELNLSEHTKADDRFVRQVVNEFMENWENACHRITSLRKIISLYEKQRKKLRQADSIPNDEWKQISRLIGKSPPPPDDLLPTASSAKKPQAWYSIITGNFHPKTQSQIEDLFGWNEKDEQFDLEEQEFDDLNLRRPFDKNDILYVRYSKGYRRTHKTAKGIRRDWLYKYYVKDIDKIAKPMAKGEKRHFVQVESQKRKLFTEGFKSKLIEVGFVENRRALMKDKKITRQSHLEAFSDYMSE